LIVKVWVTNDRISPDQTFFLAAAEYGSFRKAAALSASPGRRRRKSGIIEIELGGGRRVRVDRDVDAEALRRVLDALGSR
jgi:transposase